MLSCGVVLDACVLFPPRLRDFLLRAAEADLYQLYWTEEILEEVRRNLVVSQHTSEQQAQSLIVARRNAFEGAIVQTYRQLLPAMTNHPKDRHIVAAAAAAGAQIIVTSNLQDFPKQTLEPWGVEAQSPDVFLCYLFDLDPREMVAIIGRQQAALRRPPMEIEQILGKLEGVAPQFVRLIRAYQST